MKRNSLLVGAILGIVGHVVPAFAYLLTFVVLSPLLSTSGVGIVALIGIIGVVAVVGMILNAVSISGYAKSCQDFKKKYGVIITAIIFDFIIMVYSLLSLIVSNENNALWIYIFALIGLSVAIIFKIIDLILEKGRANKQPIEHKELTLEEKINKLNSMKMEGMINDEEFEKIKQSYINKETENN